MPQKFRFTYTARERLKDYINKECDIRLPNVILDELLDLGEPLKYKRGEDVISEGKMDDNVYFIVDGIMREWYEDGDKEVTQAFGTAGTLLISYHSFYIGKASVMNYGCCNDCKLLKITKGDYESMIEKYHLFARWNTRVLQCQLYRFELRRSVVKGSAKEKYEKLIHHRPELIRNVPIKIIASYLQITPEYLSQLRRMLLDD